MKEKNILQNHADGLMQLIQLDLPHVHAIDAHFTINHIIKARNETHQGGLAHASGANQRNRAAGWNIQADVCENLFALVVIKTDVFEADHPFDRFGEGMWLLGGSDLRRNRQNVSDAFKSCQGLLDGFHRVAQVSDWRVETIEIKEKRDQVGDGERAGDCHTGAEVNYKQLTDASGKVENGVENGHQLQSTQIFGQNKLDFVIHFIERVFLTGKSFYFPNTRETVVKYRVQLAERLLTGLESRAYQFAVTDQCKHDNWNWNKRQEGEIDIH